MIMDNISIFIGGCVVPNGVFTERLSGKIINETAKAINILPDGSKNETIWLPRKALVKKKLRLEATGGREEYSIELARWFKPDAWQCRIMNKYSVVSGICA